MEGGQVNWQVTPPLLFAAYMYLFLYSVPSYRLFLLCIILIRGLFSPWRLPRSRPKMVNLLPSRLLLLNLHACSLCYRRATTQTHSVCARVCAVKLAQPSL